MSDVWLGVSGGIGIILAVFAGCVVFGCLVSLALGLGERDGWPPWPRWLSLFRLMDWFYELGKGSHE